jgi:hypothetical protein
MHAIKRSTQWPQRSALAISGKTAPYRFRVGTMLNRDAKGDRGVA